jgi:hypothetical protein
MAHARLASGTGYVVRGSRRSAQDQATRDLATAGACTGVGFVTILATGAGLLVTCLMTVTFLLVGAGIVVTGPTDD